MIDWAHNVLTHPPPSQNATGQNVARQNVAGRNVAGQSVPGFPTKLTHLLPGPLLDSIEIESTK